MTWWPGGLVFDLTLITLPLAFVGLAAWELGRLVYIPLAWFLRRKSGKLRTVFKVREQSGGSGGD